MIDSATFQKDMIALLKSDTTITGLLASASEVREDYYMGKTFEMPCVRFAIINNTPQDRSRQCKLSRIVFAVRSYAEDASSRNCMMISKAVIDFLDDKFVTGTGYKAKVHIMSQGETAPVQKGLWRTEDMFSANIYPTS